MNKKLLAVMAVVAMAFAGVAVLTETEQGDAAFGTSAAPTAFAYGMASSNANGMYVIAYDDGALLIDINRLDVGDENQYIVGLTPDSTTVSAATEIKVGPVASLNGQIWIDGTLAAKDTGNDVAIALYKYSAPTTAVSTAALTYTTTVSTVEPITNHSVAAADGSWARVNYDGAGTAYATAVSSDPARTTDDQNMSETRNTVYSGANAGYKLKGWSVDYGADAAIALAPGATYTPEEILFAMADAYVEKSASSPTNPIVSNKIAPYAIWEEILFTLEVADIDAGVPDGTSKKFTDDTKFGINGVKLFVGEETSEKATASITSKVSKNSFALLKIEQNAAGAQGGSAPYTGQYTYAFTVYKSTFKDASGVKLWEAATSNTDYVIKMINNGIYKVTAKADLRIEVTMAQNAAAPATNAYAFQIDQINNTSDGFVNLSLDLFDYKAIDQAYAAGSPATPQIKSQIAIEGTYFKTFGSDANAVRVYGDLKNLASPTTTTTGYIDLSSTGVTPVDYQYEATKKTSNIKALELTSTDSVFDVSYQLGSGASIYAAKGVWNLVESEEGTAVTGVTNVTETPWALYKA